MSDVVKIIANQICGYLMAREGDCVYLTFVGGRHTTVMDRGIAGTVTTRSGELGVVVRDAVHKDQSR